MQSSAFRVASSRSRPARAPKPASVASPAVADLPLAPAPQVFSPEAFAAYEVWRGKAAEVMLILFGVSTLPHVGAWLLGYDLPATFQWVVVTSLIVVFTVAGIAGRRWSIAVRVWLLLLVAYLASIQGFIWYSGAMARVWLLGAPILALILAGPRSALVAAIVSIVITALHTTFALTGWIDGWHVVGFDDGQPVIILARSVMWMTFFVPVLILVYSAHLFHLRTLAAERATSARLEEEVANREAANESLSREATERNRLEREVARVGDEERRRLGHDLHDGAGQQLAVALLRCAALEQRLEGDGCAGAAEARDLMALLESTMDEVHEVARSLSPVDMDLEALGPALGALTRRAGTAWGVRCEFQEKGQVRLYERHHTLDLYRIAQEAVTNAGKHAGARWIMVTLGSEDGRALLTVEDDGRGLPTTVPCGGSGLHIMAFRAHRIGGRLDLERPPTGGTRVVCQVVPTEALR
jgi:signal transduction histidine kinase